MDIIVVGLEVEIHHLCLAAEGNNVTVVDWDSAVLPW